MNERRRVPGRLAFVTAVLELANKVERGEVVMLGNGRLSTHEADKLGARLQDEQNQNSQENQTPTQR